MLASQRDPQSPYPEALARWLELDYHRRPRPLRRHRKWVTLAAAALSGAYVLWTVLPNNHAAHQAAPVATAHALFQDSCGRCHVDSFRPVARLVHGDGVRSVPDRACLACHDGAPHQPHDKVSMAGCSTCHREHRGKAELARVADGHCTSCHRDLKAAHPWTKFQDVSTFAGDHPEFAVLRSGEPDRARLHFNHAVHLGLDLSALRARGVQGLDGLGAKLDCAACHQPDAERRYMQPIRYEAHCAGCHPLTVQVAGRFKDAKAQHAAEAFRLRPAPHKSPADVRAVLRERFLQFLEQNPAAAREAGVPEPKRPIPGRGPRPVTEEDLAWSKKNVKQAEDVLFLHRQLTEAERLLHGGGYGCAHCHHETTDPAKRPGGLPQYALTAIPQRWLAHSTFRHDSHRMLSCLACHEKAAHSTTTADVLLPSIVSCRECHRPQGGARADCAECHRYHKRDLERTLDGPHGTIGKFLK